MTANIMTGPETARGVTLERVDQLLEQLTDQEKLSLLDGLDFWHTQPVERLGIPALMLTDGPHGLRKQSGAADHLGLNQSVPATCFPTASALASSWDADLVQEIGRALGEEARAEQVAVVLGPGLNIKRSPLCGRNFEYFSEDPALGGTLAAAMARGIQSQGIGACLKHFAANNQETDRMRVSAEIDPRTLREIYLAGFERAVRASQPWTVMSSYNRINGTYAAGSRWLLTDLLRDSWGFDGLVMSDWGGTDNRPEDLKAGLDLEMPSSSGHGAAAVRAALAQGRATMEDVDRSVRRLLRLIARAEPATEPGQGYDKEAHHDLARRAAAQSAVLLKNEGGLLPLDPASGGTIAVIGDFARSPRYQGSGSSAVNPTRLDNALDAIVDLVDDRREVVFARGFLAEEEAGDRRLVDQAVAAASSAEAVVLFLGLPPSYESEGYDRADTSLPAPQLELLGEVAAANPNLVVVLSNGGVVDVASWQYQAPAVLEGWLGGQAGGSATADLLFGRVSPGGKLAETIPLRLEDNPSFGNFPGERGTVRYGEGTLVGYRWYDARGFEVAYPFGHGLSYTTFAYSPLTAAVLEDGARPSVEVRLTVRNSGTVRGREVAQVYVRDPVASVARPPQELRAFTVVDLEPGESREVAFMLDARAFAFWDVSLGRWFVEGGDFEIRCGSSSRDVRSTATVTLAGDHAQRPLSVNSTANEWLADPVRGPWLRDRLEGTAFAGLATDPGMAALMGPSPLIRLTRFEGFPVTESDLATQLLT
ncbi:MAG: glycoside hydrolase family 3 C-terminal domain-containing protein [Bifidobacteriaceae bacterium]|jgi:beta-glucosidase|nr:glycoside hydrolase family 3 C-terminal domain-containing protein [Bifidobacteriaceae bacterium]